MARRAPVRQRADGTAAPPDPAEEWELPPGPSGTRGSAKRARARYRWGGGGGRWLVWVGRILLWAFIIVVLVNGVRAPFERFTQSPVSAPAESAQGPSFPRAAAGAFAVQFAEVYLNYDEKTKDERAEKLRTFLPPDADPNFGWDGNGKLSAGSINVAGVEVFDENNATVMLSVFTMDRLMRFSVPVYTSDGGFVVSETPALLPGAAKPDLPVKDEGSRDSAVEKELSNELKAFFEAYASGNNVVLGLYGLETESPGLPGAEFGGLTNVVVPAGSGTRQVTATVAWKYAASGTLEQTYRLAMEKQSGKWVVKEIRGARP